ncbi:MAG: hypothetical protein AB7T49_18890 [Oligoflexales bacterium]
MYRRSVNTAGVVFAGLLGFAAQGFAQAPKLGFQYRTDIIHDDHGIEKTDTNKPSKTTDLSLEAANLTATGSVNEKVSYDVNYSLAEGELAWGFVKYAMMDMLTLEVGKDFTNQGGWDNYNWLYDTILVSPYTANSLPIPDGDVLEAQFTTLGLNLQLINDTASGNGKQPAWTLEYMKAFGSITPLFQFGSYDLNKSKFFVLGLAFNANNLDLYFDYVMDQRDVGGDEHDTHSNIVLDVAYTAGDYKPFVKVAKYDVKQAGTDAKENAVPNPAADADGDGNPDGLPEINGWFTDHGMAYTVGMKYLGISKAFTPFVALIAHSGKFVDAAGDTSTRSNSQLRLGVMGSF